MSVAARQNQNPGRNCKNNNECKSSVCYDGQCAGKAIDVSCHEHADCDIGTYCNVLSYWPYQSVCSAYRIANEQCDEDYQCNIHHFCWYKTREDKVNKKKVCMPIYQNEDGHQFGWETTHSETESPDLEDFRRNGKACISGLAYESAPNQATCVSATEVIFNGEKTPHPYTCDPRDPDKRCYIKYDTKYSSAQWLDLGGKDQITVNCSCALSDETSGYCKDVIGTDPYAKYARQMYYILSNSHCHTLDRDDVRAQRDSCGVGVLNEEWRFAVDLKFNITHWPYI